MKDNEDMNVGSEVQMAKMEQDIGYMRTDIKDIKDDLKEALKVINTSLPALRNDVNLANQLGQENKIKFQEHEIKIDAMQTLLSLITSWKENVATEITKNTDFRKSTATIIGLIKWIGLPTTLFLVYTALRFYGTIS